MQLLRPLLRLLLYLPIVLLVHVSFVSLRVVLETETAFSVLFLLRLYCKVAHHLEVHSYAINKLAREKKSLTGMFTNWKFVISKFD